VADDIVIGAKQFKNPKGVKPVWDEDIKTSPESAKDRSSPKPPHGFAYDADTYHYKAEPGKYDISNAPLDNPIVQKKAKLKKVGKLRRVRPAAKKAPQTGTKRRQQKRSD
jgi:hypothetical protein